MSTEETHVLYKVISDFSNLSRASTKAKKDIRDLRAAEKKANAESLADHKKTIDARKKGADLYKDEEKSLRSATTAIRGYRTELGKTRDAQKNFNVHMRSSLDLHSKLAAKAREHKKEIMALRKEQEGLNKALSGEKDSSRGSRAKSRPAADNNVSDQSRSLADFEKSLDRVTGKLRTFSSEMDRSRSNTSRSNVSVARYRKELVQTDSAVSKLAPKIRRMGQDFNAFSQWRPRLMPPFIALIPVIGAIIGMLNPLIAGLGAAGMAAFGMASNLASLSGALLAVLPAMAAMLSMVFALKNAFGGIGAVFQKFQAMKDAASGPGGGGGGDAKAELSRAEQLARANQRLAWAQQDVLFAQEDLTKARQEYLDTLKELLDKLKELEKAESKSRANAKLSAEYYESIKNDPNVSEEDKAAAQEFAQSMADEAEDAKEAREQGEKEYEEKKATGVEGDRGVIMAQRALTQAIWAQRDAQLDLINTQKGLTGSQSSLATATSAFEAAMAALSPSARKVVESLLEMKDAWADIQKSIQEKFFSKFVDDVDRLKGLLKPVGDLLGDMASALGGVVDDLILMVTSDEWKTDLGIISDTNVVLVENFGAALGSLFDIIKDLMVVAGPIAEQLSADFAEGAEKLSELVDTARDNGTLADWLETVYDRLHKWWDIVKNIGKTLFNFGKASSGFGDWLSDGFLKITEGWVTASEAAAEEGSGFQQYLEDIKPVLSVLKDLVADFFGWFADVSSDPENLEHITELLTKIKDDVGPALSRLLDTLADSEVPSKLIDALVTLIDTINDFLNNGGQDGFEAFFDTLNTLFGVVNDVVNALPESWISNIATSLAVISALTFFGLDNMLLTLARVLAAPMLGKFLKGMSKLGNKLPGATGTKGGWKGSGKGGTGTTPTTTSGLPIRPKPGPVTPGGSPVGGPAYVPKNMKPDGTLKGPGILSRAGGAAKTVGKFAKGFGPGLVVGIGGNLAGNAISDGNGGLRDYTGSLVGGASTGFGFGSMFGAPGMAIGTAVGAGVGAWKGIDQQKDMSPERKSFEKGKIIGAPFGPLGMGVAAALNPEGFSEMLEENKQKVMDWAGNIGGWISDAAGNIWDKLKGIGPWFMEKWEAAKNWLKNLPYNIGVAVGNIWNGVKSFADWASEKWEAAKTWFEGLPERLANVIEDIWRDIKPFREWLSEKWESAKAWLQGLKTRVKEIVKDPWGSLKSLGAWLSEKWESAKTWLKNLPAKVEALKLNFWKKMAGIGDWLDDQWDKLYEWITGLPSKIANAFRSAAAGVSGFAGWLMDQFEKGFGSTQTPAGGSGGRTGKGGSSGRSRSTFSNTGGMIYRSGGGGVPGYGTTDSVPAMLTPGEFVMRRAAVAKIGINQLQSLNAGMIDLGTALSRSTSRGVAHFNSGGLVSTQGGRDAGASKVMTFGDINIYNPRGQSSEQSIADVHADIAFRYGF